MSRRRRRSFDFRRYGTLQGWWDPSDSATRTIATGVSQLNDKSGNNRNFTQATGSKQPSVITSGQNGRDTLKITGGTAQNLSVPSSTATFKFLHDGGTAYVFQIMRHGETANPLDAAIGVTTDNSLSTGIGVSFFLDNRGAIAQPRILGTRGVGSTWTTIVEQNNGYSPNQYSLFSVFLDANEAAANRGLITRNGVLLAARNASTSSASASNSTINLTLGQDDVTRGTAFYGDLLIYSALGASYSESFINSLLRQKWGTY